MAALQQNAVQFRDWTTLFCSLIKSREGYPERTRTTKSTDFQLKNSNSIKRVVDLINGTSFNTTDSMSWAISRQLCWSLWRIETLIKVMNSNYAVHCCTQYSTWGHCWAYRRQHQTATHKELGIEKQHSGTFQHSLPSTTSEQLVLNHRTPHMMLYVPPAILQFIITTHWYSTRSCTHTDPIHVLCTGYQAFHLRSRIL